MKIQQKQKSAAFTLMEVMFAMAIFSMAIFAILELSTRSLKIAESLQRSFADPAMIAADYSTQVELEEGSTSGDFGDTYPNANWESIVTEVTDDFSGDATGLYQVDIRVFERVGRSRVATDLTIVLFRPPQGGGSGAGTGLSPNLIDR